eukprot:scaffold475_cov279-Pinguiococcus_pyrenoidosus.AAC.15
MLGKRLQVDETEALIKPEAEVGRYTELRSHATRSAAALEDVPGDGAWSSRASQTSLFEERYPVEKPQKQTVLRQIRPGAFQIP